MKIIPRLPVFAVICATLLRALPAFAGGGTSILQSQAIASHYYGNDAPWFEANIPFFDCSDPEITEVYYYRWQLWKSHIRDLGEKGYILTEFLNDVSWSIRPWQTLNDATAFHIHEGRWLRDPRYVDDYIHFMYADGGDNRHFSESIADAVYSAYLANGDAAAAIRYLPDMERIYNAWNDHYDASKGLYYIDPLSDATEFSIASIEASGGKWGFSGGQAFRSSINSFMYADALAIGRLAALSGDDAAAHIYTAKAADIKEHVQGDLWNDTMHHFVDRYKADNQYVHYWDFVPGRELEGYSPWYFNLPDDSPKYAEAWSRLAATDGFAGAAGLRTVEPSYQYYMRQYIYEPHTNPPKPECQWNGPAWPFDTTLILGAIANLLDHYTQDIIHPEDYVHLLRQYAHQHYLDGNLDVQEDYNPDTGAVIVGLPRSHHYNHSDFCDLVITGLCGLHPGADNELEIHPLVGSPTAANSIRYFCLENVPYHGHAITILYDADGKHYGRGAGLSVYVDGKLAAAPSPMGKTTVQVGPPIIPAIQPRQVDLAVNCPRRGFPAPSASCNTSAIYQAVDGRVWYYPNVPKFWSTLGSSDPQDWYSIDFGGDRSVSSAKLYFYSDGDKYQPPVNYNVQTWNGADWVNAADAKMAPPQPLGNGENIVTFPPITTSKVRVLFTNRQRAATALVALKIYGGPGQTADDEKTEASRIVDQFQPGDRQSEADHGLTAEDSETGAFHDTAYRDAHGFFAFRMTVNAGTPQILRCIYWGSDAGNRTFDILVDGKLLATQTLNNNKPGEFWRVEYPLPADAVAGKSAIEVRFQAHPGNFAGGLFGCTVLKKM